MQRYLRILLWTEKLRPGQGLKQHFLTLTSQCDFNLRARDSGLTCNTPSHVDEWIGQDILKSFHFWSSFGHDKVYHQHSLILTSDLDLWPVHIGLTCDIPSHQVECQGISKSFHAWRIYGLDKIYNLTFFIFYQWLWLWHLSYGPSSYMWHSVPSMWNNMPRYFKILQHMENLWYGQKVGRMDIKLNPI